MIIKGIYNWGTAEDLNALESYKNHHASNAGEEMKYLMFFMQDHIRKVTETLAVHPSWNFSPSEESHRNKPIILKCYMW
jgi:hypothetical protein